jgi:hypothetical protein
MLCETISCRLSGEPPITCVTGLRRLMTLA